MKQINAWETSDGQVFKTETEALGHQRELDFDEWYSKHPLEVDDGVDCGVDDIKTWLMVNMADIKRLIPDA